MFVEKNTFGQDPFCSNALTSVPGAPASSVTTGSQPVVGNPGVDITDPDWVAVALVSTLQPLVPRSTSALDPVAGELRATPGRRVCIGAARAPTDTSRATTVRAVAADIVILDLDRMAWTLLRRKVVERDRFNRQMIVRKVD
jgi:hypothetical protein